MLKITRIEGADGAPLLQLEGKLRGPWVDELRRACSGPGEHGRIRLDLSGVPFIDDAGERLLRELVRLGVSITACSGYVAELLKEER